MENSMRQSFDPLAVPVRIKISDDKKNKKNIMNHISFEDSDLTHMPSPSCSKRHSNMARMPSSLDDFVILSTIGSGSYGTCRKIQRKKDGRVLAWKEMDYGTMTESEKQMLVSEVNLLRELRHPNIVRYYDRIIDRSNTKIYIIMEFCDGGDLSSLIKKTKKEGGFLEEDFIWKIMIQMTQALKDCHRRKNGKAVLHRDLKPANVFLDSGENVKLGDFGLARVLHHDTSFAKTYVGTPYYMSPELVNNMSYNEKSDIWALGCIIYEMCALHPPFTASNQHELNRKIRVGDYRRIPSRYSDSLNDLISKMLNVEVHQRLSIESILADPVVIKKWAAINKRNYDSGGKIPSNGNHRSSSPSALQEWQDKLEAKQKILDAREKEMEELFAEREKRILMKEKLADEKMKRAEKLMREFARNGSLDRDIRSAGDADNRLEFFQSSCLTKAKKDPDSPKKKVTFDMHGKENLRKEKLFYQVDTHSQRADDRYVDIYLKEFEKKRNVADTFCKNNLHALDLRDYEGDFRPRSKNLNLMNFR